MMPVYFVQSEAGGPIKIGFASDPKRRLTNMQTASPDRLLMLAVIEGDAQDEARIHWELSDHRIRGEWFADCAAVRFTMAAGIPVVSDNPIREPATALDEFMQRNGLSDEDMARKVGRSRTRISKLRRGLENPSLELALDIERVTDGEVKPADLYIAPAGEAA